MPFTLLNSCPVTERTPGKACFAGIVHIPAFVFVLDAFAKTLAVSAEAHKEAKSFLASLIISSQSGT